MFDTPQLSDSISVRSQLRVSGYAFLPSHIPSRSTEDVVASLGAVLWSEHGKLVDQLKPKPATI
jgi:hypothetical protein